MRMRVSKFLIVGGIGLTVSLGLLHMFVVFGAPYLLGSIIAFSIALIVGFTLQKYWTFGDRTAGRTELQFTQYTALALTNLALNTGIVYAFVEYGGAHYLIAQTIGAGLVALVSYLVYNLYIFAPWS